MNAWCIILSLVLLAAFALAPANSVLADSGGLVNHSFDVTFTKWISGYPNMIGIGGGAIGPADFHGIIQMQSVAGSTEYVDALYMFEGSKHSFTAHVYVVQDDLSGTGVITGEVRDGWLQGATLTGEYSVYADCPITTYDNDYGTLCFSGVLHIQRAP